MDIITFGELVGHDVYEFCYNKNYPNHWNMDSLFVDSTQFQEIYHVLDSIFKSYHYYGPQKISYEEWNQIYNELILTERYCNIKIVNNWIEQDQSQCGYFWIYGV